MFEGPLTESILGRARAQGFLDLHFHDLRDYGLGAHRQVDDSPYGGGAGMVMRADVVVRAIEAVVARVSPKERPRTGWKNFFRSRAGDALRTDSNPLKNSDATQFRETHTPAPHRIYLSPRGMRLTQEKVEELAKMPRLLLLCGRYEGIDQRIIDGGYIDEEISIGDYVLTGGELPAMVLIDAVARQIPGVLGKGESSHEESFSASLDRKREYPHYTRPEEFRGQKVPDVLLSGNHGEIERWRREHCH